MIIFPKTVNFQARSSMDHDHVSTALYSFVVIGAIVAVNEIIKTITRQKNEKARRVILLHARANTRDDETINN